MATRHIDKAKLRRVLPARFRRNASNVVATVVFRQHLNFTMAAWLPVARNENTRDFATFSAAPLVEVALGIWLLSWRIERQSATERQARFYASLFGIGAVLAFSVWSAEEGLAAPILRLPGASTSAFAFVFLPTYGAAVFLLTFVVIWLVMHVVETVRRRLRPA
jgi:hypothetical protein